MDKQRREERRDQLFDRVLQTQERRVHSMKTIRNVDFLVPGLKTVSEMNQREFWAARLRRKKDQQEQVAVAMLNALRGRKVELPCVVKLTRIGPKKMDNDNLAGALKHCQDQVARQLGVDDGDESKVIFLHYQMPIGSRDYAVKVEISSR
jgi:hypothetical protein